MNDSRKDIPTRRNLLYLESEHLQCLQNTSIIFSIINSIDFRTIALIDIEIIFQRII